MDSLYCSMCDEKFSKQSEMDEHYTNSEEQKHESNNILMILSCVRCQVTDKYECLVCKVESIDSVGYFAHCRSEAHKSALEEAIEACPNFNNKNVQCHNQRCQFKHICITCGNTTPHFRCLKCRAQEICNMYNRGGQGCWFDTHNCHRKHACAHCNGAHPRYVHLSRFIYFCLCVCFYVLFFGVCTWCAQSQLLCMCVPLGHVLGNVKIIAKKKYYFCVFLGKVMFF